jgi:hypothetical protein
MVDLCLLTQNLETCERLFTSVLQSSWGSPTNKFGSVFEPLIPKLKKVLEKCKVDISSYPFGAFFRSIIETYLQHILGPKPTQTHAVTIRKIGCGCYACHSIDTFLLAANREQIFRYGKEQRTHLEGYLCRAPDLVTYITIKKGSPHGLHVIKKDGVVAAAQWVKKHEDAKAFLDMVGDDTVIERIMTPRYPDVLAALKGTAQFKVKAVPDALNRQSDALPASSQHNPVINSSSTPAPVSPALIMPMPPAGSIAGQKRKKL